MKTKLIDTVTFISILGFSLLALAITIYNDYLFATLLN